MKSTYLTAAAAVLVAGSAFAGVSTTNKIGRIKVDSGMANTIIALPFTTIGDLDSTQMNATNYVLTTNLKRGDTLTEMSVEGSSYIWSGWTLLTDGGPWTAVTQSEGSNTRPPSDTAVFNRGRALMLKRSVYSDPFYIIGQIDMNGCSLEPAANTGSARYTPTLVANPYPHSITLEDLCTGGYISPAPTTTDQIVLGTGETAAYDPDTSSWRYVVNGAYADWPVAPATVPTIPAGVGFWYRSKGNSVPTFTFPAE